MRLITLREHERLYLDSQSKTPTVSRALGDRLTSLRDLYGQEIFRYVARDAIAARHFVGTIDLQDCVIEVLPKVAGDTVDVRRNLVRMLAVAFDMQVLLGDQAYVVNENQGILEVLIAAFCRAFSSEVRRGLVRQYEGLEENLSVVRGRIDARRQLLVNFGRPERVYCEFEEFRENNPLNQIFKAAVVFLLKRARSLANRRLLSELRLILCDVDDRHLSDLPWQEVGFTRLTKRYEPSYRLVELILRNMAPEIASGQVVGFSLFFNMNMLFEEYVGRIAQKVMTPQGYSVRLQTPQRHMVFDHARCGGAFLMKPDVAAFKDSLCVWILDTKWKLLNAGDAKEGVAQADLYQMAAYATNYGCDSVTLLYPHHGELGGTPGLRNVYSLYGNAAPSRLPGPQKIRIATIDMTNLASIPSQLHQLLAIEAAPMAASIL